jgi:hypothetical protein
MNKPIFNSAISSMIIILGFSLAIAGTTVDFKFQSNPTDEQIFTATVKVLKHYKFNIWDEDAKASLIKASRKITKATTYYLEYSIEIKEKQISVLASVIEYGSSVGVPSGTVFGKTVTREPGRPASWRYEKEREGARWLIGKVIRTIGTRLDVSEFKSQIR